MALAHILHRLAPELGVSLALASIDHGLRADSAAEVRWVQQWAEALGRPFVSEALRVRDGPDLQRRAREARYEALRRIGREIRATSIAVGHTQDDQAETVLARLLRGGGLNGLAAIEPRRDDGVVRPLLDLRRAELRAYLQREGVVWLDDPSNQERRFERVRIRGLLPTLAEEDSAVVTHLAQLADDARESREAVARWAERWVRVHARVDIDIHKLRRLPVAVQRGALGVWVQSRTGQRPARRHIVALLQMAAQKRGEVLLGGGWQVRLVRGMLQVAPGSSGRSQRGSRRSP